MPDNDKQMKSKRIHRRIYRQTHKLQIQKYQRIYYQVHRLELLNKHKISAREYYQLHKRKVLDYMLRQNNILKIKILTHYGNGELSCIKCGFNDIRALSIDHINGGGQKHTGIVGWGINLYKWLKRNNYPKGYQTLCMNCQWIKRVENKEFRGREYNHKIIS